MKNAFAKQAALILAAVLLYDLFFMGLAHLNRQWGALHAWVAVLTGLGGLAGFVVNVVGSLWAMGIACAGYGIARRDPSVGGRWLSLLCVEAGLGILILFLMGVTGEFRR